MSGITLGFSYALVGAGISLIWGTLRMINLAHGELYMLGAYFAWMAITIARIPIIPGIIIGVISVGIISLMIQLTTVRPLLKNPKNLGSKPYVLTMGLSILLQNSALLIFSERYQNIPYFIDKTYKLFDGKITLAAQRVLIIIVSFVVIIALMVLIKYTKIGRAIRATSQDAVYAGVVGVNVKLVFAATYVISGLLAAVAGIMLAPIYSVNPWMGTAVQSKGMACCVLGGLGNIEGAIFGGLIIGVAESLTVNIIGTQWKDVIAYLILVVTLWVRPAGILGKKGSV
ncbi:MAG TPA: branched-chain amino acid ABC transporter permease [Syntrophaceticus sp.]|nr:branched-chain amino acid ABC transporter permease [Syntrophaceticus sp.]